MATVCTGFDMYYENWHQDLYRLCLVLCRNPRDAGQLVFEAFLRLGAVRDRSIGEEEAKSLLFSGVFSIFAKRTPFARGDGSLRPPFPDHGCIMESDEPSL